MTTKWEDWEYEGITKRERGNERIKRIDDEIRKLHEERDSIIDEYRGWEEKHKRREPRKPEYVSYATKLSEELLRRR